MKEKCLHSRWMRGEGLSEPGAQGKGSESVVVLVVAGGGGSRHQEAAEAGRPQPRRVSYAIPGTLHLVLRATRRL